MIVNSNSIMESNTMIWFRKGLRIHDNPALDQARRGCKHLYPVFVLDPYYIDPDRSAFSPRSARSGLNRIQFLLESLKAFGCQSALIGVPISSITGRTCSSSVPFTERSIGRLGNYALSLILNRMHWPGTRKPRMGSTASDIPIIHSTCGETGRSTYHNVFSASTDRRNWRS